MFGIALNQLGRSFATGTVGQRKPQASAAPAARHSRRLMATFWEVFSVMVRPFS